VKLAFTVATPETHDTKMAAFRGDLERVFGTLAEIGYDGAELMVRNPAELDAERIGRIAASCRLAIPAVSTGQLQKEDGLTLNSTDRAARECAVERTRHVIRFAARFGAQVNIGTLRGQMPDAGPTRDTAITAVRASLSEILEEADRAGVRVAVEPQCRYVSNWLNTVDEATTFAASFADHRLWLLFDVYHATLEERSVAAAMIRARPYLTWVQFSDSNRLAPGLGHLPFAEYVDVLRALGYDGYLSVECNPLPDAATAARKAAAHLRFLIG
jgi:sugar phosphate isomerase/epimerase